MIPKIFGVEVKKNIRSSGGTRRKWNEQDFIIQVKKDLGKHSNKIIDLYDYLKKKADSINWGTGNVNGSFLPIFNKISKDVSPFSFCTNGEMMIKFDWLKKSLQRNELEKYIILFQKELEKQTYFKISQEDL